MEGLHLPLLLVGYAVGAVFYLAFLVAAWRGLRAAGAAIVALYWSRRSRREAAAAIRRVATAQDAPARRAA